MCCVVFVGFAVAVVDYFIFFFNDTATTEIYTLSLHDALPISFCVILAFFKQKVLKT